jgi:outer membrane protein TolC
MGRPASRSMEESAERFLATDGQGCQYMTRVYALCGLVIVGCCVLFGCARPQTFPPAPYAVRALNAPIPYDSPVEPRAISSPAPRTVDSKGAVTYWDVTLAETIRLALQHSTVVRDLGGRVLDAPSATPTAFDPSIVNANPRYGVDQALSYFDPNVNAQLQFNRNRNEINYEGRYPNGFLEQNLGTYSAEITKTNVNGSQIFAQSLTVFDQNNAIFNRFGQSYTQQFIVGGTQPLLRGRGELYNLVNGASTNQDLLLNNGVLIARLNTNVADLDFEAALQQLVSDIEDRYWELSLAYAQMDAAVSRRETTLMLWRQTKEKMRTGLEGGELEAESQAREEFYVAHAEVQALMTGSRTAPIGIYGSERKLREIVGLPPTDDRLMRPSQAPTDAHVLFDWQEILPEAIYGRVEIRRQKNQVKRRELQAAAAKNLLMPQLDLTGNYGTYGFGEGLFGNQPQPFPSAFQNLGGGQYFNYQAGVNFSMPLGFRQAKSGVRFTELMVSRERALLAAQELQIAHRLTAAMQDLESKHALVQTQARRLEAVRQRVAALDSGFHSGRLTLDLRMAGYRSLADADFALYRAKVEYTLALKTMNLERGALLAYDQVHLADRMAGKTAACPPRLPESSAPDRPLNYVFQRPARLDRANLDSGELPTNPILTPPVEEVPPGGRSRSGDVLPPTSSQASA